MKTLHDWFHQNRREFPWRSEPTPYRVWISEVMLQQTRAAVVVPYFMRWMEQFPDIPSLAASPIEAVIKAWEGLGYYSRARNLHAAAQQIASEFGGQLPSTREELARLKGLGPYTIGAILSFGFHKRAAAVDGNVVRVLSRYFSIEESVDRSSVRKKIEAKAEEILDIEQPWVTAEALIELGASLCTPRPRCEDCPLSANCAGLKNGKALYLPIKTKAVQITLLHRTVLILVAEGKALLKKGKAGQVMADLYEFPYVEKGVPLPWGVPGHLFDELRPVEHTFTRYKAHLYPRLYHFEASWPIEGYEWVAIPEIRKLPLSSGHRKIAQNLIEISLCTFCT